MRLSRPTTATVIALTALFVSLGGSAVAASRYIITSPSQIKPGVMAGLTGENRLVESPKTTINAGQVVGGEGANCAADEHVVTGGYSLAELAPGAYVVKDGLRGTKGWTVLVNNQHATGVSTVIAEVLCAPGAVPLSGVRRPQK
jgi:hypothetical protein